MSCLRPAVLDGVLMIFLPIFCRDDLCNNLYTMYLTVGFIKRILGTWLTANGHLLLYS